MPRTRHFCPTGVPKGSARRAPEIDRAILAGVVPGLSTRKVGEGCRPPGRQAPAEIIESRMAEAVDRWPDTLDAGDIAPDVPRTRHFCPTGVPKGSARRAPEIDRAIPAGVVPGLSTRKVGEVLLALPGRSVLVAPGIRHDGR